MIRKIVLMLVLAFSFIFIQTAVFAQDTNEQCAKALYKDIIKEKITSHWFIPPNSSNKSAVISFIVNKDGTISDIKILKSSNDEQFDKSAFDAVCKSVSFKPLVYDDKLDIEFFFSSTYTNLTVNENTNNTANQLFEINGSKLIPVSNRNYTNFNDYATNLQNKINSNWNPISRKEQVDAIISISLDKDGVVENMKVQKSSNKKNFDLEIMDSIMRSAPLGPLPADFQADHKDIQLNFMYKKTKDKNAPKKYVIANIKNQDGYDEYIEQVQEIMSKKLKDKYYFCKKDILLEMNINKDGKLIYVKIKNASPEDDFIKKEFNRKTLLTLQETPFPPLPDKMNVDNITLNYRILTQRKRLFLNFICDYVWNFFRTGLESYCIQTPENI